MINDEARWFNLIQWMWFFMVYQCLSWFIMVYHGCITVFTLAPLRNVRMLLGSDSSFTAILEDGEVVAWGNPNTPLTSYNHQRMRTADVTDVTCMDMRGHGPGPGHFDKFWP